MATAITDSSVILRTLTERELYRLSWEISEELVRRETVRMLEPIALTDCVVCSGVGCEHCPKVAA